jgi:hypothetical protein
MLGFGDRKRGPGKLKYNEPDPADRAMPTNLGDQEQRSRRARGGAGESRLGVGLRARGLLSLPKWPLRAYIIIALVVITIACGLLGYSRVGAPLSADISSRSGLPRWLDYLFLSLKLLTMGSTRTYGDPYLMVGRWSGALVAFGIILKLAAPRLEQVWQDYRTRRLRHHTVVIGLGSRGQWFIRDFSRRYTCVGLDLLERTLESLDCLHPTMSITLLKGDARDRELLLKAGIADAWRVVVVTGDDLVNLAIAHQIAALAESQRTVGDQLEVIVHVADRTLRLDALSALGSRIKITVRPFSIPVQAARQLVFKWPFPVQARLQGADEAFVVFVGFDGCAEELLLHIVQLGRLVNQGRPRIAIFAPGSAQLQQRLARNYPALDTLCSSITVSDFDPSVDLTLAQMGDIENPAVGAPVTAIVVTAASDTEAMVLSRRLRLQTQRLRAWRAPIFVHTEQPTQFSDVLAPIDRVRFLEDVIEPFGDVQALCSWEGLRDWHERLAHDLHAGYLAARAASSVHDASPRALPWSRISEEYRDANRRAVDHLSMKLAVAGLICRSEPPVFAKGVKFEAADLSNIAWAEHNSWSAEKLLLGWHQGTVRNDRLKVHNCLVPFEQLGDAQFKDDAQIADLNDLLSLYPRNPDASFWSTRRRTKVASVFKERFIAIVGHNVITGPQAERAGAAMLQLLRQMDVTARLGAQGSEFWTLVTPLAPGCDFVLTSAIVSALSSMSVTGRYRVLVVSPCSLGELALAYWETQPPPEATIDGVRMVKDIRGSGATPRECADEVARLLGAFVRDRSKGVEFVVDLSAPAGFSKDMSPGQELRAFDACDQYLLTHCDELIAGVDPARYGLPPEITPAEWVRLTPKGTPHGTAALVSQWLNAGSEPNDVADASARASALHLISLGDPA